MKSEPLRHRGPWFHALIGAILFVPAPASLRSATEFVIDARAVEEIDLLEELAGWIDHEAAVEDLSWRQAVRERRDGFEVFRTFHAADRRSAPLAELPFGDAIGDAAERHGVDPLLLAAMVEVESGFDPQAISHRGATGLLQLMPATAGTALREQLADPERNLDAGARYLSRLLERYGGDLVLALAAYNAGPTNVRRHDGVPPFRETRKYLERVLGIYVAHHRKVWEASETLDRLARL